MPSEKVNEDSGSELTAANWLLDELCIPAGFSTRDIVAQAIRHESKRLGSVEKAAKNMLKAAHMALSEGERLNRFWFEERKYLQGQPPNPGAQLTTISEDEAYLRWQSMSEAFKRANPWSGVKA